MKSSKKRKKIWKFFGLFIFIAGVAVALIITAVHMTNLNKNKGMQVSLDGSVSYGNEKELEEAMALFHEKEGLCEILGAYKASQRKSALSFCGFANEKQMEEIKELLMEYDVPASFFIDAKSAAENAESVRQLQKAGFIIGNYGMNSEESYDQAEVEQVLSSLVKSQTVLKKITGEEPFYFKPHTSYYSTELLQAGFCSGLRTAVKPTEYLSNSSFPSFNAALGFVSDMENGSIIMIKLDEPLDELEYETEEETAAVDQQQMEVDGSEEMETEVDIVQAVEYLLEALSSTETAVVSLDRFLIEPDATVDRLFIEKEKASDFEVKKNDAVDFNNFENTLFIGDSLTLGLYHFSDLKEESEFCAYKSVTAADFVNNITTETADGKKVSLMDEINRSSPEKIYILLGTNALASGSNDSMIEYYGKFIEDLKLHFANIPIYIQGIPPVTKKIASERISLTNGRIRKINIEIAKMAKERNCYYIDLYSALKDEEGNLTESYAREDGIHLNKEGCERWIQYLKEHTVEDK